MRLIEPYHGLLGYTTRALWMAAGRDPRMRSEPPVSRQGSKASFAPAVFRAFGLQRAKWTAVAVNDLCPVAHLFALLLASRELRDATARRISSLVPCPTCLPALITAALEGTARPTPEICKEAMGDKPGCEDCEGTGVANARALWERIRKTPVPGELVEACAAACYLQARAFKLLPVSSDGGVWSSSTFYEEAVTVSPSGFRKVPLTRPELASRLSSLPSGFASLADLTAAALFMQSRSFQLKPVSISGGAWSEHGMKPEIDECFRVRDGECRQEDSPRWTVAERVGALPGRWEEAGFNPEQQDSERQGGYAAFNGARWAVTDRILSLPGPGGVQIHLSRMDAIEFVRGLEMGPDDFLVCDPPYEGTSGYASDSHRDHVLEICDRGHRAGALVLLHEAVGLAKELGKGWQERPASPLRSRSSSFWAGGEEREWLTSNRSVSWWPAEQVTMFPLSR